MRSVANHRHTGFCVRIRDSSWGGDQLCGSRKSIPFSRRNRGYVATTTITRTHPGDRSDTAFSTRKTRRRIRGDRASHRSDLVTVEGNRGWQSPALLQSCLFPSGRATLRRLPRRNPADSRGGKRGRHTHRSSNRRHTGASDTRRSARDHGNSPCCRNHDSGGTPNGSSTPPGQRRNAAITRGHRNCRALPTTRRATPGGCIVRIDRNCATC